MIQLSPGEGFPIVRVLKDWSDIGTYYVRAVVRDATTDTLLDTVDLTDKGNRRFSKVWKVVADNTYSQGRYIVITTTVYDDAGYTNKSLNYQEEAETYVIQQRWNPTLGMGGGGVIDERTIKKAVGDVLDSQEKPKQEFPIKELVDLVRKEIKTVFDSFPKPEKVEKIDLSLVERSIKESVVAIVKEIRNIPEPEKVNFTSVLKELSKTEKSLADMIREVYLLEKQDSHESSKQLTKAIIEVIAESIKNGDLKLTLFGSENPFSNTKEKRKNYLELLTSQFKQGG